LYHRKFKQAGIDPHDIKGITDLKKLPYVTKKDFRASTTEDLLPQGVDIKKYSMVSTSGSTGKPVTLYSDAYTVFHTFIGFVRMIREHDINWRKTRMAVIADLTPDSAEAAYFTQTALPNLKVFFSLKNMKAFHVGEKPEKLIADIEAFNPEFLGGYPEIIKLLAILKRQGKAPNLQPRVISTSGAIVDAHTREYITKSFQAKLFDVYGATECSPMAFQCREGNYHIHPDFVYMEFLDPKEKLAMSGDGGNIVVTRLFGCGTPVIRYTGVSDFVVPTDRKCPCSMHTPLIEQIGGRQVDAIQLANGEFVLPSTITGIPHHVMHLYHTDKIQQFQIIQQTLNEVEILLVVDEQKRNVGANVEEIKTEIKKQFEQRIGPGVSITVREVDKITMVRPGSATPPPVVISKVGRTVKK
jgi:phenylacetate-coenzyme A ligase PaaK-like adenylate-forming protein